MGDKGWLKVILEEIKKDIEKWPKWMKSKELENVSKNTKKMKFEFTARQMADAFIKAEAETAEYFMNQTCGLKTKDGNETCPICFFHITYRKYLGIDEREYQKGLNE